MLAEPLYLTKYIERMGTGTRDMIAKCRAADLPEPEFSLADGFVTTLRRPVRPGAAKTPAKTPVKTPDHILAIVAEHPQTTLAEIAAQIGKSKRAVERAAAKLVKAGRLRYVGPAKGGHWEIPANSSPKS